MTGTHFEFGNGCWSEESKVGSLNKSPTGCGQTAVGLVPTPRPPPFPIPIQRLKAWTATGPTPSLNHYNQCSAQLSVCGDRWEGETRAPLLPPEFPREQTCASLRPSSPQNCLNAHFKNAHQLHFQPKRRETPQQHPSRCQPVEEDTVNKLYYGCLGARMGRARSPQTNTVTTSLQLSPTPTCGCSG